MFLQHRHKSYQKKNLQSIFCQQGSVTSIIDAWNLEIRFCKSPPKRCVALLLNARNGCNTTVSYGRWSPNRATKWIRSPIDALSVLGLKTGSAMAETPPWREAGRSRYTVWSAKDNVQETIAIQRINIDRKDVIEPECGLVRQNTKCGSEYWWSNLKKETLSNSAFHRGWVIQLKLIYVFIELGLLLNYNPIRQWKEFNLRSTLQKEVCPKIWLANPALIT